MRIIRAGTITYQINLSPAVKNCFNYQLNAQFLYSITINVTLQSSTCFEHYHAHLQEVNCIITASVSSLSVNDCTVRRLRAD